MNVLITGGVGFLGSHIAADLLVRGHRVTLFDNLAGPSSERATRALNARFDSTGRLSFVFRDVRDAAEVGRALRGVDAVFHAAGVEGEESGLLDPREDFSTRVGGTFNVLEGMRAFAPLAHLILPSTAAVYGRPPILTGADRPEGMGEAECCTFAATERQPVSPEDPYASGAACAEKYAIAYARAYGLRVTVFRLSTVYGHDAAFVPAEGWLPRLIAAARGGNPIAPPADPRWPMDLLHADDFCAAAAAAWETPSRSVGQVFNVGGGARNAFSLFELSEHLGRLGGQLSLLPTVQEARPAFVLDCSRVYEVSGWRPSVDWRAGIDRVFAMTDPLELSPDTSHQTAAVLKSGHRSDGIEPMNLAGGLVAWPRAEGQA